MSAEAYQLRALLRPHAMSARVRMCGLRPAGPVCGVRVAEFPDARPEAVVPWVRRAWFTGIARCGRQYACPVCALARAAKRRDELVRMQRGAGGRWEMVTLTMAHRSGERLLALRKRLMAAWRKVRTTRVVREIFERRVTASARALEVTYGTNGFHPHLHLLLRTESWNEHEKQTLLEVWMSAVECRKTRAVVWSGSKRECVSEYLSKMGAELAGIGKEPKNGNLSPWQLARRALTDETARALWYEYQTAMRGARLLELDERAKAFAATVEVEKPVREWRVDIFAEEFYAMRDLERRDPLALWLVLESAISGGLDPPAQVRICIDDALEAERARIAALRAAA